MNKPKKSILVPKVVKQTSKQSIVPPPLSFSLTILTVCNRLIILSRTQNRLSLLVTYVLSVSFIDLKAILEATVDILYIDIKLVMLVVYRIQFLGFNFF